MEDTPGPSISIDQVKQEMEMEDCTMDVGKISELCVRIKGVGFKPGNVKEVQEVMKGPRCWKCYDWGTFFACQMCGKNFHRECAFMTPGFPHPVFDASVEEACKAEFGQVNILKCTPCIVAEETRVAKLRDVAKSDLNKLFGLVTKHVIAEFAGDLLEHFPPDDPNAITAPKIVKKASRDEYETVEGFYADFKMILFNTIVKHSTESEATTVAKIVLKNLTVELSKILESCWECGIKNFQENGKLFHKTNFAAIICEPCQVPHAVLWLKEGSFPYWPTKVFTVKGNEIYFQCFGDKAGIRKLDFPHTDWDFKTYSTQHPGYKVKSLQSAVSNCNKYLNNLRVKFGQDGVVIPKEAKEFDGNLLALMKEMFPLYNGN